MAKKLLDLAAIFDRNLVRIEGTSYELRTNEELPPLTVNALAAKGARVYELQSKQPLSTDESAELKQLPGDICRSVLLAPEPVLAALTDEQQWAVCQAFLFQRNPNLIGLRMTDPPVAAPGASSTGAS